MRAHDKVSAAGARTSWRRRVRRTFLRDEMTTARRGPLSILVHDFTVYKGRFWPRLNLKPMKLKVGIEQIEPNEHTLHYMQN